MNQILLTPNNNIKYKRFFQLELIFSILVIVLCLFYLIYLLNKGNERNRTSNALLQPYSLSQLYSSINVAYEEVASYTSPFIIGTLKVPSLDITLPVISEMNDDLLKLSVCRFYGPMPNQVGNICIAGHNYNDGSFFSNIPRLSIGDSITLTDLSHNQTNYTVYEKYEISASDTSCTSQETNGQKEITLVTCNNFTGNRIIIKAK